MLLRRLALALLLCLAPAFLPVLSPDAVAQMGPQTGLNQDHLVIETKLGQRHSFTVDLALTPQQQAIGLMFVEKMPDEKGMLFLNERESRLSFWMKNTLIPLDIMFVDANGYILNIQHGQPLDLTPLPSAGPALAVLEINGGLAAKLGIKPGDRLLHPAFGVRRP
ncbi:hypothetical protein CHU95_15625 [Niveispirillum lacus]|uniref:DUF192 domain-containing protein n=1 Tax=Niveispirillum lacus TaxID=1981099 RepID=A0A255YX00_9PROT|nr:DUF192 domain-containing protein [Niveispirillum lacus]OYQ33763.1 hypothetical protein CHU95_15625 [Niveispirillum lacus]